MVFKLNVSTADWMHFLCFYIHIFPVAASVIIVLHSGCPIRVGLGLQKGVCELHIYSTVTHCLAVRGPQCQDVLLESEALLGFLSAERGRGHREVSRSVQPLLCASAAAWFAAQSCCVGASGEIVEI